MAARGEEPVRQPPPRRQISHTHEGEVPESEESEVAVPRPVREWRGHEPGDSWDVEERRRYPFHAGRKASRGNGWFPWSAVVWATSLFKRKKLESQVPPLVSTPEQRDVFHDARQRALRDPDVAVDVLRPYAKLHLTVQGHDASLRTPQFLHVLVDDSLVDQCQRSRRDFASAVEVPSPLSIVRLERLDSRVLTGFVEFCIADLKPNHVVKGWFELRKADRLRGRGAHRVREHACTRDDCRQESSDAELVRRHAETLLEHFGAGGLDNKRKLSVAALSGKANAGEINLSLRVELEDPDDEWYAFCLPAPLSTHCDLVDFYASAMHMFSGVYGTLLRIACALQFLLSWRSWMLSSAVLTWWLVVCLKPFFFIPSTPLWAAVWLHLSLSPCWAHIFLDGSSTPLTEQGMAALVYFSSAERVVWLQRLLQHMGLCAKEADLRQFAALWSKSVSFHTLVSSLQDVQWTLEDKRCCPLRKALALYGEGDFQRAVDRGDTRSLTAWALRMVFFAGGKVDPDMLHRAVVSKCAARGSTFNPEELVDEIGGACTWHQAPEAHRWLLLAVHLLTHATPEFLKALQKWLIAAEPWMDGLTWFQRVLQRNSSLAVSLYGVCLFMSISLAAGIPFFWPLICVLGCVVLARRSSVWRQLMTAHIANSRCNFWHRRRKAGGELGGASRWAFFRPEMSQPSTAKARLYAHCKAPVPHIGVSVA